MKRVNIAKTAIRIIFGLSIFIIIGALYYRKSIDGNSFLDLKAVDYITIIGTLATLTGLWATLEQLLNLGLEGYFRKAKDTFASICRPGSKAADYDEIYKTIFDFYGDKLEQNTWNRFDCSYFNDIIKTFNGGILKVEKCKFPLIYKSTWVKSKNENFTITKSDLDTKESHDSSKHRLYEERDRFLSSFGIADYPPFLASIGKEIWDAPTFDLHKIEDIGEGIKLSFKKGSYYNFARTCEVIGKELYFKLYRQKHPEIDKGWFRIDLPNTLSIRETICAQLLNDFSFRPAKLGINICVLMRDEENKYHTFVQKRGEKQVEYPGIYHIAPAGTFQPLCDFDKTIIEQQYSFEYTILRELLEEVYNLEEADKTKSSDPFKIFLLETKTKEPICPGEKILGIKYDGEKIPTILDKTEYYEVIPTGFMIDLVTLKPEMTVILIIKKGAYTESKKAFEGNWEGSVKPYAIESNEFKEFLKLNLNTKKFLPAGAVALAEGIRIISNISKARANQFGKGDNLTDSSTGSTPSACSG